MDRKFEPAHRSHRLLFSSSPVKNYFFLGRCGLMRLNYEVLLRTSKQA